MYVEDLLVSWVCGLLSLEGLRDLDSTMEVKSLRLIDNKLDCIQSKFDFRAVELFSFRVKCVRYVAK